MIKQLVHYPKLYYEKVIILLRFHKEPLIICGGYAKVMSYGKETDQRKLIYLNLI